MKPLTSELNKALYGKKRNKSVEKDVQSTVIQWLNTLPGCRAWRQNSGSMVIEATETSKRRMIRVGERGLPDVTGIAHGWRFDIEIKKPGKTPSDEQIAWIFMIRNLGGIAFWCNSLAGCAAQLRDAFEARGIEWKSQWEVR